jgi:sec-independent protein translocase protein TatA
MGALFAFGGFTGMELVILLGLGVLLFGRRLPEVGRYLGKGITEFKKGLHGLEDEMGMGSTTPIRRPEQTVEQIRPPQRVPTTAPKFEDAPNTITPPPKVEG